MYLPTRLRSGLEPQLASSGSHHHMDCAQSPGVPPERRLFVGNAQRIGERMWTSSLRADPLMLINAFSALFISHSYKGAR